MILFALEDAYQQLQDGKTESFIVVSFGISADTGRINMVYKEFYFDKTWTYENFFE